MKKSILLVLGAALVLSLSLAGCEKKKEPAPVQQAAPAAEAPTPTPAAAPAPEAPASPAANAEPTKENYIKAAIEIGCMSRKLEDKTQLKPKAEEIQQKYGFNSDTWMTSARKFANDAEVGPAIGKGLKECP